MREREREKDKPQDRVTGPPVPTGDSFGVLIRPPPFSSFPLLDAAPSVLITSASFLDELLLLWMKSLVLVTVASFLNEVPSFSSSYRRLTRHSDCSLEAQPTMPHSGNDESVLVK
jgi:hypothetical protein